MGIKSSIISPIAKHISKKIEKDQYNAVAHQEKIRQSNVKMATSTVFGEDYGLSDIRTYEQYRKRIPVLHYEKIKGYMDRVLQGEKNILWPGQPSYIVGTAGTTSGIKYIPLSKESIPYHFGTARNATMSFAYRNNVVDLFDGNLLFLSGSPKLDKTEGGILTGRLSGIVNHQVPQWMRGNQVPSYETNIIPDWEEKVMGIIKEIHDKDLRMISGIPPWVTMFMEQLIDYTGKDSVISIFQNLRLFIYGGMNYEPYRQKMEKLIGKSLLSLETYPATEGFIAYQTDTNDNSLLLNTNAGVFFEFVPTDRLDDSETARIPLEDVKVGVPYAIMLSNNAGLFCSMIGDIIEFTSIDPYRLLVKGRTKHFISAFGEHVIGQEVEKAFTTAIQKHKIPVDEFTVAPMIAPTDGGLPYHEWCIEVEPRIDLVDFSRTLDQEMQKVNFHYKELVGGKVIRPLQIHRVRPGSFARYQKSLGKLGGQNKVARLSNDRAIIDKIINTSS